MMQLVKLFTGLQPGRSLCNALWTCGNGHAIVIAVHPASLKDAVDDPPTSCDVCKLLRGFETKVTQELSADAVGPAVEQVAGEILTSLPGPDDILDQALNTVGVAERSYVVQREASADSNFRWSPAGQFTELGVAKGAEANWHAKGYATRILQVDEVSRQKGKSR